MAHQPAYTATASSAAASPRVASFDVLKCLTIFLVILGHCYQRMGMGMDVLDCTLGRLTTLVDMPMFMLMCGYFAQRSLQRSPREFALRRWHTLLVPMLVFCLLTFGVQMCFKPEAYNLMGGGKLLVNSIIHSYWFVWTLLMCSFAVLACVHVAGGRWQGPLLLASWALLLLVPLHWPIPHLLNCKAMYPFFLLGYLARRHGWTDSLLAHWRVSLAAAAAVFAAVYACYDGSLAFYYMATQTPAQQLISYVLMLLGGTAGFVLCLLFSHALTRGEGRAVRFLKFAGQYTLALYMMQGVVMTLLDHFALQLHSQPLYWLAAVALFLLLTLLVAACTRSRLLSAYLLGKV